MCSSAGCVEGWNLNNYIYNTKRVNKEEKSKWMNHVTTIKPPGSNGQVLQKKMDVVL